MAQSGVSPAGIELISAAESKSTSGARGKAGSAFSACQNKTSTQFGIDKLALKALVGNRENVVEGEPDKFQFELDVEGYGGANGMMHKLCTDMDGIHPDTLGARHAEFGQNCIPDRRLKTFCELIFEALQDFTLILLLVSGTTQLLLAYIPATASSCDHYPSTHAWVEPFTIYVAVAVVCLVAAGTDYGKQLQMKEQQEKKNKMAKYPVIRNGVETEVEKTDLVVGDVVTLEIGMIVPADAYFLKGKDLQLDESALTGEPHLMNKSATKPWLLSGTMVKNGTGTVLIVAVGPLSVSGEITMKVLGLSEDDITDASEHEGKSSILVRMGCASPPPIDPKLELFQPAKVVQVRGKGKKASYTIEYTASSCLDLNGQKRYTENLMYDQFEELCASAKDIDIESKGHDNSEDDRDPPQTPTLEVGAVVHVKPHREFIPLDEVEEVSGLEQKLDSMAGSITGFGFALACISMVLAAIIWAILKFGMGKTTGVPAETAESGFLIDASFWAKDNCEDHSLLQCYHYHSANRQHLSDGNDFCIEFFTNASGNPAPNEGCKSFGPKFDPQKIVRILVTGITILVVAIPEGLPLAVTLAIAFAQKKLYGLNNFVKTLDSCETMGSATTICSDKTGTLTQNRMTTMRVFLAGQTYSGTPEVHVGKRIKDSGISQEVIDTLAHTMAINSGDSSQLAPPPEGKKEKIQNGNKTECGLLGLVEALGQNYTEIRQRPEYAAADGLEWGRNAGDGAGKGNPAAFPFSSSRKRMSWLVPKGQDMLRVHCKGASEVVLARCGTYMNRDAEEVELDSATRENMLAQITDFANRGLRTLVLAYRDVPKDFDLKAVYDDSATAHTPSDARLNNGGDPKDKQMKSNDNSNKVVDYAIEHDLTLIAIVGIADPLREGVKEAISKCARAGVDVRMVTGDQINTAIAISTNAGILREEHYHHVFEGNALYAGKNKQYFDLLEHKHESIVKITKTMKSAGVSGSDIEKFVRTCAECRGKKLDDGTVTQDPVQCLRDDFAMTGRTFARRVYYHQTTTLEPALAPGKSYGKPVRPGHVNQEELDKIWPKLRVMARCQPQDKLTLVKGLMQSLVYTKQDILDRLDAEGIDIYPDKQVVAVTGDGTNDAPALKAASVGFAMGIEGTEVAQDAANIILLNDNFADIVVAMKWGRNIYDSIQKFIQFQLTVNIVACVLAALGAVLYQESPLGAVQMLWVNLVMDSLASLALATEPPTEALLDRRPYGLHESIIKRGMWVNMLGQAIYQLMICLIILFKGHILFFDDVGQVATPEQLADVQNAIFDDENQLKIGWFAGCEASQHYTMLFNAFVMMTLFNQIAARKLKAEMNIFEGVTDNIYFVVLVLLETTLQILLVQFAGDVFKCYKGGLTGMQWGFCILFGFLGWIWQLVLNVLARTVFREVEEEGNKASAATTAD